MYFVACLVLGFHSHLHLSSFNKNTNIHMKGECKTVPSLCRGEGHIVLQKYVLNKKLFFWLLLQYTWSGILNLIKIIHVPQSITMRVTPPCVLRAALFRHCVAYCVSPCFGLAYCVPFNNKTTIFGNFIYIEKIKWQYAACTFTIILANVKFGVFAC